MGLNSHFGIILLECALVCIISSYERSDQLLYGFSHQLLQISEVVSSMKDLIDFCRENKVGPIGNFFSNFIAIFLNFDLCG